MTFSYSTDATIQTQHKSSPNIELSLSQTLPFSILFNQNEIVIEDFYNYVAKESDNKLVLVGQSISTSTIAVVCQELKISRAAISAHPMHLKLGQYAYILRFSEASFNQNTLAELSKKLFIDIFIQSSISVKDAGILIMDMDSTVIAMECIDEIADLAGVKSKVAEVTERAMRGEIAFTESLHHRVACLKGVKVSDLDSIRMRLPFSPKFLLTMQTLKNYGWTLVLASGGFTFFANYIKELAQLDYAFSNTLGVEGDKLSGTVIGDVVDADRKASILKEVAQELNVPLSNTLAIGDGANDLKMMNTAGWSIAYRAKPAVSAEAKASINFSGFDSILYMLSD